MTASPATPLSTHWLMPRWWIHAYEAAARADANGMPAMEHALRAGLAPAQSVVEMNALAAILATLQTQILGGRHAALELATDEHVKHATTASKHGRLLFERTIQNLAGIRLLTAMADGSTKSQKLFAQDSWRLTSNGAARVELKPTRLGIELTLGMADAHMDLAREALGEETAAAVLGDEAPLALPRSLWLELGGADQLLLLRLEKAMQWQFRWLQLEGTFGMPIGELFHGLERDLATQLRSLAKLGKKLAAHGHLQNSQAASYLAVAAGEEQELSLVWQVTKERFGADASSAYRGLVAAFFKEHRFDDALESLLRLFLPESPGSEALAHARALWERLAAVSLADAPAAVSGLEHAPSQMIAPRALYFELLLRAREPRPLWRLPSAIAESSLKPMLAAPIGAEAEGLKRLAATLDESPELLRVLRETPLATLTSKASRRVDGVLRSLSDLLQPRGVIVVASEPTETPPSLRHPERSARHPERSARHPERSEGPFVRANAPNGRRKGAVSGAVASRMLRIAADELTRMRSVAPDRYGELKRAYLSSLDQSARRLMLDVQKRMQPNIFEDHLRQRLVRYMVDHPGAWRSDHRSVLGQGGVDL